MQRTAELLPPIRTPRIVESLCPGAPIEQAQRRRTLRARFTLRQAAGQLGVSVGRVHEAAKFLGFTCLQQACPRMSGVELERLFHHFTLRADVFDC